MRARVDSALTLDAREVPPKVVERLRRALSFPNPAYLDRLRLGLHPGGEPETFCLALERGNELRLPRGAIHVLRRAAAQEGLIVACEDARVLPAGTLPEMPELPLRDYQAAAVEKLVKVTQGTVVIPCGGGKCVADDSLVFTDRGLLTAAEIVGNVPEQHAAFCEVAVDTAEASATTNAIYNGGWSDTRRVRLALGYELEATPEHPIRVLQDGILSWKRADELEPGDRVVIRRGSSVWGSAWPAEPFRWIRPTSASCLTTPCNLALDELGAEVCGLLVAEGTLTAKNSFEFTNADPELVEIVSGWAASLGVELVPGRPGDSIGFAIHSVIVREFLVWLGIDRTRAGEKCIPHAVRRGGRRIMQAFLRGLFDGDASVDPRKPCIEFCTKSERLAREVQIALLGLDILASRHPRSAMWDGQRRTYWRVVVNDLPAFEREIGFSSSRLTMLLRQGIESRATCRNPNADTIPVNGAVRRLYDVARRTRSWNADEGRLFGNYVHGAHAPSRGALRRLVERWGWECPEECAPIEALLALPVAFLAVEVVEQGRARVVDLSVPVTHEFVANGVVCHNTRIGLGSIARLRTPSLVLVHTLDLAEQWLGELKDKLGLDAGLIGDGEERPAPVTVAVVQALVRWEEARLDELLGGFGLVILDEAHHVAASTFHCVVDRCPARYRLGLTATPEREDGLTALLDLFLGAPLAVVTHEELVEAGVLTVPEIRNVETEFSYPYTCAEDYAPLLAAVAADERRNQLIVDAVVGEARAGNVCLVLSGRIDHCRRLADGVAAAGVSAAVLTGEVKRERRKELLDQARAGELSVLVATSLADEGLDLPRLSRVFLAFPSRARGRTLQRLGRLMRPHPGKRDAVLFDFVDRRVPILRRHHLERRRLYAEVLGIPASMLAVPRLERRAEREVRV